MNWLYELYFRLERRWKKAKESLYELHFRLERRWKKAKGSLSHVAPKFRQGLRNTAWEWFTRFWDLRKVWGGRGRWMTYGTLAGLASVLVACVWFLFGWGRHSLAEWRAEDALALLDENKTQRALLKARTAYLAYPENLDFLRIVTKVSREARAADYRERAEELAQREDSTAEDVLPLVDDLLNAGNLKQAERFLKVAREKGMERRELVKRLLRMDLLAGSPGRIPALLRASAMVRDGADDPETARTYAALCTLWKNPELRKEALEKLQGWTARDDETGLAALRALTSFPELDEVKKEAYRKLLIERGGLRMTDKREEARLRFLQNSQDAKYLMENDWEKALGAAPFSTTEKLALHGGILWRLGREVEGKTFLNKSLSVPTPTELPLVDREILFTGDLDLTIRLLLKYRERPWLQTRCDGLLINLYHRKKEKKMAAITANGLLLASLRSQPNLLAMTARSKIFVSREHLPEAASEMERLVSRYPHDPNFRELLGFAYHLLGKHRLALELVARPPEESPITQRARAKALRLACLRELKEEPAKEDTATRKELQTLDPLERELLKI